MKLTVSSLLRYLKQKLDQDGRIQNVIVAGELSNFHRHHSGHLYFSLKDEFSCINCVMFKTAAQTLNFDPKNGDQVLVKANTSIFEVSGQLQLYVTLMKLDGVGDLYKRYEELKNKLFKEGYFNDDHKKPVPAFAMRYGVVVGDKSAAMSDIQTTFKRRWPIAEIDYYPVLVQGKEAANNIVETLKRIDSLDYDVIILARGGGSFEDLFAFNDESLVKTIYELKTFIVTGIGHQQDFTLADYVADLRAPTPTASVELTTCHIDELIQDLKEKKNRLNQAITTKLNFQKSKLEQLQNRRVFKDSSTLLASSILKLEFFNTKLYNSVIRFQKENDRLKEINNYLNLHIRNHIRFEKNRLKRNRILLDALSHEKTLNRGYSYVTQNNQTITALNDLNREDTFEVHFKDGIIKAKGV